MPNAFWSAIFRVAYNAVFAITYSNAAAFTAGKIAVFVVKTMRTAAYVFALNAISKALLPKPPKTTITNEMTVSYSDTASPGVMVLGRVGIGGTNTIPP